MWNYCKKFQSQVNLLICECFSLSLSLCACYVDWLQAASLFQGTPPPGRDHVQREHEEITSQDTVWQVPKRPSCDQSRGSRYFNLPVTLELETEQPLRARCTQRYFKKLNRRNVCTMSLYLCIILNYFVQKCDCVCFTSSSPDPDVLPVEGRGHMSNDHSRRAATSQRSQQQRLEMSDEALTL